jgi:hypothetical protein
MEQKTKINAEDGKQELMVRREFDLPLELLFKAYVEPGIVEQWMGTKVLKLENQKFAVQLEEWAYAGFFFVMSGAVFSHIASGDPLNEIFPALLLLILTVVSWYFRPAHRKIISVNQ